MANRGQGAREMKPVFILAFDGLNPEYFEWQDYLAGPYGRAGILRSTRPPQSPQAWTSFLTGVMPPEHGVKHLYPPHRWPKWKVRPWWYEHNVTFALYNMPCFVPLPKHHRVLEFVGGMYWDDDEEYAKPARLKQELDAKGYHIDWLYQVKTLKASTGLPCLECPSDNACWTCEDYKARLPEINRVLGTDEAFERLLESIPNMRLIEPNKEAEVIVLVYTFVDRAAHRFWSDKAKRGAIYQRVRDEATHWLMERGFADERAWAIISDHGVGQAGGNNAPHCYNGVWASMDFNLAGKSIADVLGEVCA
jgi:hypothetical protein